MKNLLLLILLGFTQISSAQTLLDIVAGSEDHTTLQAAIEASTLTEALSAEGTYTMFAPTNAAFDLLPEGTVDAVLAAGGETLDNLLLGHVIEGNLLADDLAAGTMATSTLGGTELSFEVNDDGAFVNGAQITVFDIEASNGTLHVIDMVILADDEPFEGSTVYEIIQNSDDHTTLESAIDAAELDGPLSEAGPFTVFAPTDQAFAILGDDLDAILADQAMLTDILSYHVTSGALSSEDLENGQMLTTLQGGEALISIFGESIFIEQARVVLADIVADNGIVHVIDVVLTPPPTFTVLDIINESEDHTIFASALAASGLDVTIDGGGFFSNGPVTIFAPTDAAFEALPEGELDALLDDPTGDLVGIIYNHIVAGNFLAADLSEGVELSSFSGEVLTVALDGDNVFINDAQVVTPDLQADNGVLHVIDSIIPTTEVEVGIEDLPTSALNLFPVPAVSTLNITVANASSTWDLAVFNIVGQVVRTTTIDASASIDVSDLATGTYIMQLTNDTQRVTKQFMVK